MFCKSCLEDCIRASKKCPKCRKTVNMKQILRCVCGDCAQTYCVPHCTALYIHYTLYTYCVPHCTALRCTVCRTILHCYSVDCAQMYCVPHRTAVCHTIACRSTVYCTVLPKVCSQSCTVYSQQPFLQPLPTPLATLSSLRMAFSHRSTKAVVFWL